MPKASKSEQNMAKAGDSTTFSKTSRSERSRWASGPTKRLRMRVMITRNTDSGWTGAGPGASEARPLRSSRPEAREDSPSEASEVEEQA